ncbi:MAG TPA: hypothetical protein DHV37_05725 [Erysipelotrichaceae bacterium]|nr:hypothetical protein [Erysipelotrichaceae bacterium]
MSYIPDCRTDEYYNEKYLKHNSKLFVKGFDWAVKEICMMFSNLEVFPDVYGMLANDDDAQKVEDAIKFWAESARNELITSMLDDMTDEEYEEIKECVDGEGRGKNVD